MYLRDYCVLLFLLIISQCYAFSCRFEDPSKLEKYSNVFDNCVRQIEGNTSGSRRNSADDWTNHKNKRNQWQRDYQNENGDRDKNGDGDRNRDNGNRDRNGEYGDRDRNRDRDDSNERSDNRQNKNYMKDNQSNRMNSKQSNNMGSRNDRMGSMNGVDVRHRGSNDMMNSYGRNGHLSGQDEFLQSEEYGSDTSHHNTYYPSPSSQPSRRYKREKRVEMNSGQRSQYNPHSQRFSGHEDSYKNERNSSDNSSREVNRACVLHCYLENLHMTGDNGMPDRYLITHNLMQEETDEDIRDSIQESTEECFQILDNENIEDKCEFSKNLFTCLLEKGRPNCDDWTEKARFLLE
ncbi:unnamed protein product, partial [Brenthis ino]